MGIRVPMTVEMDDGRELKAIIDQRDYAAAEAMEIDPASQRNIWVRYLTYNALHRSKQYGGTWEQFNTVDCVEAISNPEESDDAEGGVDPGRTVPGDGN